MQGKCCEEFTLLAKLKLYLQIQRQHQPREALPPQSKRGRVQGGAKGAGTRGEAGERGRGGGMGKRGGK